MKVWLRRAWKAAWRKASPVEDLGPGAGEGLATGDPCRWCQPEPEAKVPSGRKARQVGSDLTGKHQHGVDPEGWNAREVHTEDLVQSLM